MAKEQQFLNTGGPPSHTLDLGIVSSAKSDRGIPQTRRLYLKSSSKNQRAYGAKGARSKMLRLLSVVPLKKGRKLMLAWFYTP